MNWAIFVSGEGSNLQAALDLEKSDLQNDRIVAVVADRACRGLERAREHNKKCLMISPKEPEFLSRLLAFLKEQKADGIFLLGYMRILSKEFLEAWSPRKIFNLHPSLLPAYPGKNSIEDAYRAKEKVMGITIHEVTTELDGGPIVKQLRFTPEPDLDLESLKKTVHQYEHLLVCEILREFDRRETFSS